MKYTPTRTSYNARYTFSAKEKDTETGYSYVGARYYNSELSVWLSVDPMADKYPSMSPYTYCANNPVKLVDPNGEEWETAADEAFAKELKTKANNQISFLEKQNKKDEKKATALIAKGKDEKAQQKINSIGYRNKMIGQLKEGVENLQAMGDDKDHKFHFNINTNRKSNVTQRNKGNNAIIDINIFEDFKYETGWHECVHVGDWLQGEFSHTFRDGYLGTENGNQGSAEEHAYKSEFSFSTLRFLEKGIHSIDQINGETYKKFK